MKVRPDQLPNTDRIRYLDYLYTAAASLSGRTDVKNFLKDLLTMSERVMLGRRVAIARMLVLEKRYDEICTELGVGSDTVRRVHRWLVDDHPGYEKAVDGLRRALDKRGVDNNALLTKLKRKYPLHFLLFPWPHKKKPD